MSLRVPSLLAIGVLLAGTSCGGDGSTGPGAAPAFVMFLNLTGQSLTFSADGITDTGGDGRFCLNVDPVRPNLVITDNFRGMPVTGFTPSFQSGRKYTVFVTQSQSGALRFLTTSSSFTPSAGNQGIRFFNGVNSSYDIYISEANLLPSALTPVLRNAGPSSVSDYADVRGGLQYLTGSPAGGKQLALTWGAKSFPAGTTVTLWVAYREGLAVSSDVEDCTVASTRPVS